LILKIKIFNFYFFLNKNRNILFINHLFSVTILNLKSLNLKLLYIINIEKFIFLSNGIIVKIFNLNNKFLRRKKKIITLLMNFFVNKIEKFIKHSKIVVFKYLYNYTSIYFNLLKVFFSTNYIIFWIPKFNYLLTRIKKYNYIKRRIRKRLFKI